MCEGYLPTKKRGWKAILVAAYKLRLKREVWSMKAKSVKVNYKKLINECDNPVSHITVTLYLKQQGMMYKKIRSLPLKPLDEVKRCDFAKKWLSGNC